MAENLSRVEDILDATIEGTEYTGSPLSRVEQKLLELKQMISEGISPADTATIRQAVTDYLAAHPIEGVDESTVNALIADYIDEHPIEADTSDIWKAQGELGAKNLLVYPYPITSGGYNGVTFTAQSDGSFIVNGTSTGYSHINLYTAGADDWKFLNLKVGEYKMTLYADDYNKITQGGVGFLIRFTDRRVTPNVSTDYSLYAIKTNERKLTITQEMVDALNVGEMRCEVRIFTSANMACDNVTVYPMLRYASDADDTWQPYAKTNYELTQDVNSLSYIKNVPIAKGSGANSIVEGNVQVNVSDGENSHAEGKNTKATNTCAHAEGYYTTASGNMAHAEGNNTTASGGQSHAEGQNAKATNTCAHAEGYYTTASGNMAHAEGNSTNALGNHSHAQNLGTVAKGFNQTAIGKFNLSQGTSSSLTDTDYALIIGNGTDADHRSNALAVKWDGTIVFADGTELQSLNDIPSGGGSVDLTPIWNGLAEQGVKNLLPFPYNDYNGEEQAYTSNGLAFLAKSDNSYKGRVDVSSEDNTYPLTVGSSNSEYRLYRNALEARDFMQKGIPFKLVSTRSLPSGVKLIATIGDITLAEVSNESRTANFTITDDLKSGGFSGREMINVSIVVPVGTTITESFAVWPMLTYANVTDLEFDKPGLLNVKGINDKIKDIYENHLDPLELGLDDHEGRIQSLEQNGGSGSGAAGADGKSAYQIAVDNGFSGTESEWLASLKGDKGDRGESSNNPSIPKVFLTGDTSGMSKENPKDLFLEYKDGSKSFNATANVKWQGSSSLSYPKKNFTIKLYQDATKAKKKKVDVGFGEQSKYVLKANYIDHSHARNIVCARLWGDIVASRTNQAEIPTELLSSPNNGAVDGYPIKLYLNGVYQGLYTWNVPKDGWMMGMDSDNPNHAILVADGNRGNNSSTQFRRTTNFKEDTPGEWTIEFPDADQFSDALKTSFNNLLTFVSTSSDEDFVANLSNYANVQSLIDYYIFAYLICGLDNLGKNLLMCTFDGTHWFASAYDLDSTFGLWWDGTKFVSTTYRCPEDYQENKSLLWQRIEKLFTDAIKERYSVLRSGPMSVTNVICRFEGFTDLISQDLYDEDGTVYSGIPSKTTNNIRQIRNYYINRCAYVDGEMETLGIVTLSGITATKTTQQYNVGDTVDTSDITVVASYSDGTTTDVTSSAIIDASAVDTSTDGVYIIGIAYTEDDVTVTTTCTITVGEGSQEPVVDDKASFTPTLTCSHGQALNPGDIGEGNVYRDYLIPKTNNHSYLVTTPNSLPIYTDETRTAIAGYAIPVPATAQKVNMNYSNAKVSTWIRFVDDNLQFIGGGEVSFMTTQNVSYEFSNLSKHPKWINVVGAGSSQSAAASMVLTFE